MIYCVEDERNIRELLVYTLETTGFEAEGFETGVEFDAAMKKSLPGKKTAYAFCSLESPFPTAGTKEKSNTYPPLFGNPPDMSKVMWPGDFFVDKT